jgi:hypothetical protein
MIMEVEEVKEAEDVKERPGPVGRDRERAFDRICCNAVVNRGSLSLVNRVRR